MRSDMKPRRRRPRATSPVGWTRLPGKLSTWLLAVVLLAAVPVLVVQVHSDLQQRERRRGEVAEQVQRSAELVAARIHRLVDNAQVVLATVGRLPKIEARDRTRASMS